jgi:hypothetical protein
MRRILVTEMNVHVVFNLKRTFMGMLCVAFFISWHLDVLLVVWSIRKRVRFEVFEAPK